VEVEPDGRAAVEPVALDVARWAVVEVDATGAGSLDDVLARLEEALRGARSEAWWTWVTPRCWGRWPPRLWTA